MSYCSHLNEESRRVVTALETGNATKKVQENAALIIRDETKRADDNAKKIAALENQITGMKMMVQTYMGK